ncbi:ABC transporter permease [Streptosporangium carneum]|uniref:Transport permease protein n=1 Tax=Streptosporangium carneum TaxID=47481 RepID=A0A9W6MFP8_9ACTN|nr:ABC transporter permease [Streptosporangium carneum]GLK12342.1 hypothetical protein GCM10017600_57520 [Streptosporangium carneum]
MTTVPVWRGSSAFTQFTVLTGRALRTVVSSWQVTVLGLLQPVFMLLVISEVFGSMANPAYFPQGVRYIDYLMPGILITTGIGPAVSAGVGLIKDLENGVMARFRSLPIGMYWVLFGRGVADLARAAVQILVMLLGAVALLGFSPPGGVRGMAFALLIALFVTWSLAWTFIALGAFTRSAEVMQAVGFLAVFPLTFASSAFVPLDVLPGWLQAVATVNPLSHAVNASRHLTLSTAGGAEVPVALLASLVLAVLAQFVAMAGIRRKPLTA